MAIAELYGRNLGAKAAAQVAGQAEAQQQATQVSTEQNVAFNKSESINKLQSKANEIRKQASDIDVQLKQQDAWVNKSMDDDTLDSKTKGDIVRQYNENVRMLNAEKSSLTTQIPVYEQFMSEIKALPANQYYDPNQIIDIALKTGHETYLKSSYVKAAEERQAELEKPKYKYVGRSFMREGQQAVPSQFKTEEYTTRTNLQTGEKEKIVYSPEGKEIGYVPVSAIRSLATTIPKTEVKQPSKISEIIKTGVIVAKAVTPFTARSELSSYMPYTKEEYERLQKISTPPTLKEKLAFGLLPYLGKRAEMIQLSGEIQEKVNDAAKFTEKVTPVIEKNFKDLSKYDSQYANAVNGYNKFLESKGIKKPDGTYELSDKDYNDALSYEKSLNTLKDALDNKINDIKTDFQNNDIKYKDTSNGLEITDDRIKRIGKLQTYSQAYLKEMSDRGKLGQGLATLGTLGILETAGWVVALTPISAIVAKLPIVRNVLGVGKYIAKPIKVASALTISAGLTAASAYSRYKEYLPLGTQTAKLGAVSGAAEMVGGYALGATLINIVDNVNFQKGVKENIMNILKDKSGELSPEKRRRKAQQQLVKVEKDVSEKIAYTKEQADFEFKNADYDRQRKIIKDVLQQINSLPTQEEKLQGLLNLNEFLKRTIGKEEAKKLVQSISVPTFRIVDTSAITSPVKVTTPIVISKGGLMPVVKPISPAREWAKLYKPINPIEEYYNRLETRTIIRVGSAFKTRERTATATATALATKYRDEQIAIQKQAQASAQKYAQQVKQAQALAQKQEQKLMQQYRQAQPQLQVQRQAQKQEQQQKQVYQQAQKLIQQQKIMQNQILRQAQKLNASLKITTMKPIEIIPIIGIPIFAFEDKSEKKRKELEEQSEQAYQALIKRKGKYMPVGKPMQKARAERLGEFFARTTLARTFKVAPTQLRVKATRERYQPSPQFRGFKIEKGRKVPLVDTFIQKGKYSLSARSEVAEIQKARLLSKSMNQKARSFLR